jgi:hypothetical protein
MSAHRTSEYVFINALREVLGLEPFLEYGLRTAQLKCQRKRKELEYAGNRNGTPAAGVDCRDGRETSQAVTALDAGRAEREEMVKVALG